MQKCFSILLAITLMVVCPACLFSQASLVFPFWVVEGNIKQPTYTIIRFYDEQSRLIKEEKLAGKFLNIKKKRNRVFLDRKLAMVTRGKSDVAVKRKLRR